ncbi:uncharacterized protein BX663DRAFT_411268, partial [Cokeromyces recurvatus]|uniref:uncharacterized protein n=1 Tax=Cokeromyces recurvatus TaxID=90255 RepID=UPI00221EED32
IWQGVLSIYFPYLYFSPDCLYQTLRHLWHSDSMTDIDLYLGIIYTTLWQLWNVYWKHGITNPVPFPTMAVYNIIPRIVSQINKLI